ncbi:hypothetical protein [Kitasatospora sp. NPDC057198]|uniref:hypothetical protein n=1 Tax=Kitasatospora sp. NPDC057198 TaxID=3346046 RepID=UPI00363AADD6
MKHHLLQVLGMILFVLGAQGAVRLLVDHADTGLLARLPGGFPAALAVYVLAAVAGALLADRAHRAGKAAGKAAGKGD